MIFQRTYQQVLDGTKTQTRRLHWPKHLAPGKTRAAVPGRGKPAWWFGRLEGDLITVESPRDYIAWLFTKDRKTITQKGAMEFFAEQGFVQARILIKAMHWEPLQAIGHADALAEGVQSVAEYTALWDSINMLGKRWADEPQVCVIDFRRTDELVAMLDRMEVAG